ncbi:MAG: bifunctional nuclease family protein [Bacteroidota bacterium]
MQQKIRLEIIGLSSSHSQIGHYALVLGESNGNRRLPIIIGGGEAQAIALELENIKTNRPMTHDLIFNLARHFDINLVEVIINDLQEGIFYARLILEVDGEIHEIDSRPSDAVAIGVRFKVPIFSYESVLEEAGIVIDDEESSSDSTKYGEEPGEFSLAEVEKSDPIEEEDEPIRKSVRRRANRDHSKENIGKLMKQLDEAIAGEDYEKAAQLRDEINRLSDD